VPGQALTRVLKAMFYEKTGDFSTSINGHLKLYRSGEILLDSSFEKFQPLHGIVVSHTCPRIAVPGATSSLPLSSKFSAYFLARMNAMTQNKAE